MSGDRFFKQRTMSEVHLAVKRATGKATSDFDATSCDRSFKQHSLPEVHLAVKQAMDTARSDFEDCFEEEMPNEWRLEIEKLVWKNLLLSTDKRITHHWLCPGGIHNHAVIFMYRALRKQLKSASNFSFSSYSFFSWFCIKYGEPLHFACFYTD